MRIHLRRLYFVFCVWGILASSLSAQTDFYWNHTPGSSDSFYNRFNWALEPGGTTGHRIPLPNDSAHFVGSGHVTSMGASTATVDTSFFNNSNFSFSITGGDRTFTSGLENEGSSQLSILGGTLLTDSIDGSGRLRLHVAQSGGFDSSGYLGGSSGPEIWLDVEGGNVSVQGWLAEGLNRIRDGGNVSTGDQDVRFFNGTLLIEGSESRLSGRQLVSSGTLHNSGTVQFNYATINAGELVNNGGDIYVDRVLSLGGIASVSMNGGKIQTEVLNLLDSASLQFNDGLVLVEGDVINPGRLSAGDFGFTGSEGSTPVLQLRNAMGVVDEFNVAFSGEAHLNLFGATTFESGLSRLAANGGNFKGVIGSVASWDSTETLIGHSGSAELSVYGELNTVNGRVGAFANGDGRVDVHGGQWNSSSRIRVGEGESTTGEVNITFGGEVNTPTMVIGHNQNSRGQVTINGTRSRLNITGAGMAVGNEGSGNLTITSNGSLVSTDVNIGSFGGTGVVQLSHWGWWENSGRIRVGRASGARGELFVDSHARVTTDDLVIGDESGAFGTVMVSDEASIQGSTVTVGRLGTGDLQLSGGAVTFDSLAIGTNGVVSLRGGELVLDSIELASTSEFQFFDGVLSVGAFHGSLVQDGGALRPGNSPGSTSIDGDYTINEGRIAIEIGGRIAGDEYDFISTAGDVMIGSATLDLTLIDGFELMESDEFLIFSIAGSRSGFFEAFGQDDSVGTYGSKQLRIDYLAGDGNDIRLYVTAVPEPNLAFFTLVLGLIMIPRCRATQKQTIAAKKNGGEENGGGENWQGHRSPSQLIMGE